MEQAEWDLNVGVSIIDVDIHNFFFVLVDQVQNNISEDGDDLGDGDPFFVVSMKHQLKNFLHIIIGHSNQMLLFREERLKTWSFLYCDDFFFQLPQIQHFKEEQPQSIHIARRMINSFPKLGTTVKSIFVAFLEGVHQFNCTPIRRYQDVSWMDVAVNLAFFVIELHLFAYGIHEDKFIFEGQVGVSNEIHIIFGVVRQHFSIAIDNFLSTPLIIIRPWLGIEKPNGTFILSLFILCGKDNRISFNIVPQHANIVNIVQLVNIFLLLHL